MHTYIVGQGVCITKNIINKKRKQHNFKLALTRTYVNQIFSILFLLALLLLRTYSDNTLRQTNKKRCMHKTIDPYCDYYYYYYQLAKLLPLPPYQSIQLNLIQFNSIQFVKFILYLHKFYIRMYFLHSSQKVWGHLKSIRIQYTFVLAHFFLLLVLIFMRRPGGLYSRTVDVCNTN